ncbi:peptide deformylase [Seonamhaeicola algicola]|uniref:Peptide deformylase n=1 Tax=Seonamhaeicola algicola TaxID=1719036 RepID=A0A5C7AD37_9FLAO|nr:peptide deformylase [Seonamhaeicola algicola]TXE06147.1 peptide deformylase [Seonamhaeicola algicola]
MKQLFLLCLVILLIFSCTTTKNTFSKSDIYLINQNSSSTPMRVYKITNKNDSIVLRTKSTYIKPNPKDSLQQKFIKRLFATVRDSMSLGVGIAAPQVGVLKNIIWVQRFDKENIPFEVYLNPRITNYSKKTQTVREGCLSIPNRTDTLSSRSFSINIEYDTPNAEHKTETISGFTSVIFQHEIDHLNGILYLDHLKKDLKNDSN